jgi:hypothetical protein
MACQTTEKRAKTRKEGGENKPRKQNLLGDEKRKSNEHACQNGATATVTVTVTLVKKNVNVPVR